MSDQNIKDPPKKPSQFDSIHITGFPCGAKAGHHGTGWGPVTCPGCLEYLKKKGGK